MFGLFKKNKKRDYKKEYFKLLNDQIKLLKNVEKQVQKMNNLDGLDILMTRVLIENKELTHFKDTTV